MRHRKKGEKFIDRSSQRDNIYMKTRNKTGFAIWRVCFGKNEGMRVSREKSREKKGLCVREQDRVYAFVFVFAFVCMCLCLG